jgi:hypothetical protein
MAASDMIDDFIAALPGETRRSAPGEWGIRVAPEHAAGSALDVGLRLAKGILRVQAHALDCADGIDPWMLLWWNRQTRYVRFACTAERDSASVPNRSQASNYSASMPNRSREVWVHGDLPVAAVDEVGLDRLLGLVVEGAVAVRDYQKARLAPADDGGGGGWLPG